MTKNKPGKQYTIRYIHKPIHFIAHSLNTEYQMRVHSTRKKKKKKKGISGAP